MTISGVFRSEQLNPLLARTHVRLKRAFTHHCVLYGARVVLQSQHMVAAVSQFKCLQ